MPTPVSIKSVPRKRVFTATEAARYLGLSRNTLRELDAVPVYRLGARRVYLLEDLEGFASSLPRWGNGGL